MFYRDGKEQLLDQLRKGAETIQLTLGRGQAVTQ
jgi:hypothetical protein